MLLTQLLVLWFGWKQHTIKLNVNYKSSTWTSAFCSFGFSEDYLGIKLWEDMNVLDFQKSRSR